MIDYTLRECPFCGNPAEVVDGEPFSWFPAGKVKAIRCSNEWCRCHDIDIRFHADIKSSELMAREDWNRRKRKNKLTWLKQEVEE